MKADEFKELNYRISGVIGVRSASSSRWPLITLSFTLSETYDNLRKFDYHACLLSVFGILQISTSSSNIVQQNWCFLCFCPYIPESLCFLPKEYILHFSLWFCYDTAPCISSKCKLLFGIRQRCTRDVSVSENLSRCHFATYFPKRESAMKGEG